MLIEVISRPIHLCIRTGCQLSAHIANKVQRLNGTIQHCYLFLNLLFDYFYLIWLRDTNENRFIYLIQSQMVDFLLNLCQGCRPYWSQGKTIQWEMMIRSSAIENDITCRYGAKRTKLQSKNKLLVKCCYFEWFWANVFTFKTSIIM